MAVSAVSAEVTDGLGGYSPGASFATRAVAGAAAYVADSATEAALGDGSFGHDLEANLPGLAASTAASAALGPIDDAIGATGQAATSPLPYVGMALSGVAGAIAGAATQSALTGSSFGRTLEDQLPGEVVSSIGSTIGGELAQTPAVQDLQASPTPSPSDPQPSMGAIIAVPDPLQPSYGEFLANYVAQSGDSSIAGPSVQVAQLSDAQEAAASGGGVTAQDTSSEPTSTVQEIVVTAPRPSHNFIGDLFSGNFENLGNDLSNGNIFPAVKPAGVDGTYSNYFYYEPPTAAELSQLHQAQQTFRSVVENEVAPVVNRQLVTYGGGAILAGVSAGFAAPTVGAFAVTNASTISSLSLGISSEAAVPGSSFAALGTLGAVSGGAAFQSSSQVVGSVAAEEAAPEVLSFLNEDGTLLNADLAVIDSGKLTNYALAPSNPKAVVFQSALGYDTSNASDLLTQLQEGVVNTPASPGVIDEFGSRFRVDIPVTGANGSTATVRTAFIYDPGSSVPRLVTAYVK